MPYARGHFRPLFLALYVIAGLLSGRCLAADWDSGADISGRTHTPGLSFEPNLGLHQILWGDPSDYKFGYMRAYGKGTFTPTYVAGTAGLTLYPISFLSVGAARTWDRRYRETGGYDCDAYQCIGTLHSSEVNARVQLAYESFFLSADLKRQFFDENQDEDQDLMDPANALIYRKDGSTLNSWTAVLGKKLTDEIAAGLLLQRGDLDNKIRASEADYLIIRSGLKKYGWESLTATVGVGRFDSDIKNPGISFIAILGYTGAPLPGPSL